MGENNMLSQRFYEEQPPGVGIGLAYNPNGGGVMYIESMNATTGNGSGKFTVTGQLGDVMKEST